MARLPSSFFPHSPKGQRGRTNRPSSRRMHTHNAAMRLRHVDQVGVGAHKCSFVVMASSLPPSSSFARRAARARTTGPARGHSPTGHWTFLSSFPPLDVGQASGGRVEGRSPPARASISGVQISSSAFRVRIISSIVCLHWKLRGANALICVREMEASPSALALGLAMAGAWARL